MYSFDLIYMQVDLIYLTLDHIYQILTIYLKTDFCPIWWVIKLEQRIKILEVEIKSKGIDLEKEVHDDFRRIIDEVVMQCPETSFQNLFWKEQKRAFCHSSMGQRWRPMMRRFALHLYLRSSVAYWALKESSVIKLPSERTLRDYSKIFHPNAGFRLKVFAELKEQASNLCGVEKYVTLMFDELSVQDDLVFNRITDQLVGFFNLGDEENKLFWKEASCNIAAHALVFMVRGIASRLKFSLGYFETTTATSSMLYPLVWRAIGLCERYAGLKVIAVVSDKATSNQKLYRMMSTGGAVTYKAKNVFSAEPNQHLFLFSDPPHLLKTIRNNLANSGHEKTRFAVE